MGRDTCMPVCYSRVAHSCVCVVWPTYRKKGWFQPDLDKLESDLVEFLKRWKAFNVTPVGTGNDAGGGDDEAEDADIL